MACLLGEILPVVLMFPLVLPIAGGSWQWGFVIWSVPVAIIAVIVLMLAPHIGNRPNGAAATLVAGLAECARSGGSALCSAPSMPRILPPTLSFPTILRSTGQSEWIGAALSGLNTRSVAGVVFAARICRPSGAQDLALYRLWPAVRCRDWSESCYGTGAWVVAAATLQGFAASAILILVLALPATPQPAR